MTMKGAYDSRIKEECIRRTTSEMGQLSGTVLQRERERKRALDGEGSNALTENA